MANLLANGTVLKTKDAADITIVSYIEHITAHQLYRVRYAGEEKVFTRLLNCDDDKKNFYETLAAQKILPTQTNWPIAFCDDKENDIFGFICDPIPEDYTTLSSLLFDRVSIYNPKQEIDVCLSLATVFGKLAEKGYFISSLSEDDVAFNINNGNVYLNIFQNISAKNKSKNFPSVRFIPPEYSLDNAITACAVNSRYILASLMFIIFFRYHPLDGASVVNKPFLSNQEMFSHYIQNPVFMFDLQNTSNRPSKYIQPQLQKKWDSFPEYIKELFSSSFSQNSKKDPSSRPDELTWITSLAKFRSCFFMCACGNTVTLSDEGTADCLYCGKKFNLPYKLQFTKYTVPVSAKARVYRCQVTDDFDISNATNPVGIIVSNPNNPQLLGFKNIVGFPLSCLTQNGNQKTLAMSETAPLNHGIQVSIYNSTVLFINSASTPAVAPPPAPIEPEVTVQVEVPDAETEQATNTAPTENTPVAPEASPEASQQAPSQEDSSSDEVPLNSFSTSSENDAIDKTGSIIKAFKQNNKEKNTNTSNEANE